MDLLVNRKGTILSGKASRMGSILDFYNTNPHNSSHNPSVPPALTGANMDLITLLQQLGPQSKRFTINQQQRQGLRS